MIRVEYACHTVSEANQRGHWAKAASRKKMQRLAAWAELRAAGDRPGPGLYTVRLTRIAPRRLDDDNAVSSMKATRDGVADWLGINDGSSAVKWEYGQERGAPKQYAVRIEIQAREA